jgi:hypothetical protein
MRRAAKYENLTYIAPNPTKQEIKNILVMSLLDKVSGELNIYIGGYVTWKALFGQPALCEKSQPKRRTPPQKEMSSLIIPIDCSPFVAKSLCARQVSHMFFPC